MIGIGMILCGIVLLFLSSLKTVEVIVNGQSLLVRTFAERTAQILKQAGIAFTPEDHITPGLAVKIRNGERITVDRTASVSLRIGSDSEPLIWTTWQKR